MDYFLERPTRASRASAARLTRYTCPLTQTRLLLTRNSANITKACKLLWPSNTAGEVEPSCVYSYEG